MSLDGFLRFQDEAGIIVEGIDFGVKAVTYPPGDDDLLPPQFRDQFRYQTRSGNRIETTGDEGIYRIPSVNNNRWTRISDSDEA